MKKIIILMGVPGSGKGTQAKKIAQKHGYGHISTGDLLRALDVDPNGDPEDKKKLEEMRLGKLMPDELIYRLAFKEMDGYLDAGKGVVLDGAIRNVEQAKKYQEYFVNKNLQDEVVVLEIKLSDETSFNRLTKRKICKSCGHIIPYSPENDPATSSGQGKKTTCEKCGGELYVRSDDNPETARKRIAEQGNGAIGQILDFYRTLGTLISVDGEPPIEDVEKEIEKKLHNT